MSDDPQDPLETPYVPALREAVEAVYATFGEGHVSAQLERCRCSVCMDDATRQQIIQTPTRALSEELICAYSNSAHGVPRNLDDLRLLLPRYLDLLAQDVLVDFVGVGAELTRFGDAVRMDRDVYSKGQWQTLNDWARVALFHFGYADAVELDNLYTPAALTEVLLVGGWDVDVLTAVLDDLFADLEIGTGALIAFAAHAGSHILERGTGIGLDWFAMRYTDDATRGGLATWLNSAPLKTQLMAIATDPNVAPPVQTNAGILVAASGRFSGDAFPKDRAT